MSVLTTRKSREEYKLVGVSLPPQVHNYLSLYIAAKRTTKSIMLKKLIDDWIEKEKETQSHDTLIVNISEQLEKELLRRKELGLKVSFTNFKREIEKELFRKGVCLLDIKLILGKVNHAKDQRNGDT